MEAVGLSSNWLGGARKGKKQVINGAETRVLLVSHRLKLFLAGHVV